mgnify:CR=1 FL=1
METNILIYFVALIFLTTATMLLPTTVKEFSLIELTKSAEKVVWAHCKHTALELVDGELYTNYEFVVIETIKGRHTPSITLSLPGGIFQGEHYKIVGMPIFNPGIEELLFLTQAAPLKSAWPIGLYQGAARIIDDVNGVSRVFFRHKPHLAETFRNEKLATPNQSSSRQSENYNGKPLETVLSHIRSLISGQSDDR